jgi:Kef-type K+ transport system membrane component KefB
MRSRGDGKAGTAECRRTGRAGAVIAGGNGMLPIEDPVLQFTVLVLAALVAQLTVERVHLPGLLGLLVLGMLLGPGGFEVMTREPVVDFLGPIGLIYVMFLAGLEIDLDVARDHAAEAVGFGLLAFVLSFVPAAAVAFLVLDFEARGALLLGALLSSHTLLAYPIVERLGLLERVSVVTAIGGTLLTDTLALVLLAIVVSSVEAGGAGWIAPLGLLAGIAAIALLVVPRLSRAVFRRPTITRAEKALFVLVVLLVIASATEITGTEEVLGAFLAGIALNRSLAQREELREHLEFVGRMLFIPFFFVYTGMLLELEQLLQPRIFLLSGLLLLFVVSGKTAAAWIIGARYHYPWRDRLLMAGLTTPQAAATLAITVTGSQAGLLDAEVVDAVVLLIFVTCLVGPVLTMRVGERISAEGDDDGAERRDTGDEEPVRREV